MRGLKEFLTLTPWSEQSVGTIRTMCLGRSRKRWTVHTCTDKWSAETSDPPDLRPRPHFSPSSCFHIGMGTFIVLLSVLFNAIGNWTDNGFVWRNPCWVACLVVWREVRWSDVLWSLVASPRDGDLGWVKRQYVWTCLSHPNQSATIGQAVSQYFDDLGVTARVRGCEGCDVGRKGRLISFM